MTVKIRAKQSLASSEYGKLRAGEMGYCKASTAKYLQEKGMADIVEENVEAPVKEVKPFIQIGNYQPKEQSQPILYQPEIEEKQAVLTSREAVSMNKPIDAIEDLKAIVDKDPEAIVDEPEQAAGKKEITEDEKEKKEQKETPKKQYK